MLSCVFLVLFQLINDDLYELDLYNIVQSSRIYV